MSFHAPALNHPCPLQSQPLVPPLPVLWLAEQSICCKGQLAKHAAACCGWGEVCGKGRCMRNPVEDVITSLRQTVAAPAAEVAETGLWSVSLC